MLSWFQALLPKDDQFFALFAAHAATLPKGAAALNSGFTQPVPRQQRFKLRLAALRYREPAASESSWKAFHCAF